MLLLLEFTAVLLLFNPSLDIQADILHFIRRRELYKSILIHAHFAKRILLSSYGEWVLLQLTPVNALLYLQAVARLSGTDGLTRLFLVYVHTLLKRVLIIVYALQYACDILVDSKLAVDVRVRLSLIGCPDRHSNPLLALPAHYATDLVRLLKPIVITRDYWRGLLVDETCFYALIFKHLRQISLSFAFVFLYLLFFLVSLLLF